MKRSHTLTIPYLIDEALLSTVYRMGSARITLNIDNTITITKEVIPSNFIELWEGKDYTQKMSICLSDYKYFYLSKKVDGGGNWVWLFWVPIPEEEMIKFPGSDVAKANRITNENIESEILTMMKLSPHPVTKLNLVDRTGYTRKQVSNTLAKLIYQQLIFLEDEGYVTND